MGFIEFLPVMVYILLIVLLIILIVLGIKVIIVVDKTEKLMTDIQEKVSSFNSIFSLINLTSEKLTLGVTSIIDTVINLVNKIFRKRKGESDYE